MWVERWAAQRCLVTLLSSCLDLTSTKWISAWNQPEILKEFMFNYPPPQGPTSPQELGFTCTLKHDTNGFYLTVCQKLVERMVFFSSWWCTFHFYGKWKRWVQHGWCCPSSVTSCSTSQTGGNTESLLGWGEEQQTQRSNLTINAGNVTWWVHVIPFCILMSEESRPSSYFSHHASCLLHSGVFG